VWFWDKFEIGSVIAKLVKNGTKSIFIEPKDKEIVVYGAFPKKDAEKLHEIFDDAEIIVKKRSAYVKYKLQI